MLAAPVAARALVESTRVSHYRYVETFRHSLRDGFNGLLRALPGVPPGVPGLLAPVALRNVFARLDLSAVEAHPHDLAVRIGRASSSAPPRPSHPASHVRDDRDTLQWRRDGAVHTPDFIFWKTEIFLIRTLDTISENRLVGQIS